MLEACPILDALITRIPADEEPLWGNAPVYAVMIMMIMILIMMIMIMIIIIIIMVVIIMIMIMIVIIMIVITIILSPTFIILKAKCTIMEINKERVGKGFLREITAELTAF